MTDSSTSLVRRSHADAPDRRDEQLRYLRFLDALQDILCGCGNEAALYGSAVHRIASGFDVDAVCLAAYDPVADGLSVVHAVGDKRDWDGDVLLRAVREMRSSWDDGLLAIPVMSENSMFDERAWGVVALWRDENGPNGRPYSALERHMVRGAAARIAVELERRRVALLDDVLDGLLRKTKPIDVYSHALRELRRFVRYDHSASVMTTHRGLAQVTVRSEKVLLRSGHRDSLVDSSRRGRDIPLRPAEARYLASLAEPLVIAGEGTDSWVQSGQDDPDALGLCRVVGVDDTQGEWSVLCYPLTFGGQMLGILRLAARRVDAFNPLGPYLKLLDRFARLLSVTLYRSELYYQSDRQLQAIKEIGRTVTEPIPVDQICERVLQLALRVLHVQVGVVGLLNDDGELDLVAHHGCTLAEPPALRVGDGIAGGVILSGKSRAVPEVSREPGYVVFNARVRSELVAPIVYDREVIGFIDVESYEEGRFREEDEEVITFLEALANQAAIAIKTAQLHFEALKRLSPTMAIDPGLSSAGLQDLLIGELRDKIEQLAGVNQRLETANKAKSEFLARMSHDLRGPLNVIVGLANLLTDPAVAPSLSVEKQQESLQVIHSSGEVLASLIGNILDLSALEAGKVDLNPAPVDADGAFNYLQAMADTLAKEAGRSLVISVSVDPSIRTITVDEDKFMRIMINLISNAVKFTLSGGSVDVVARVDGINDVGDPGLHLVVSDTGVGVPADQHEIIFDPFQRVEGTAFGQRHSSGLGLAVVRELVELHGGRVWVESTPGVGSSFHVHLPYALDGVDDVTGDAATDAGGLMVTPVDRSAMSDDPVEPAPALGPHTKGMILAVEDTDAHMNLMRLAVTSRGYNMHGVASGEEALKWLEGNRPDVILLDMQLPGIDGFAVASEIRRRVDMHAVPVIAVTADALAANEERARASGCDAYLTKPIDIAVLLATIDRVTA